MTNTIVVGVDGTDTAARAGHRAAELAVSLDAEFIVLTAFDRAGTERIEIGTDTWIVSSYPMVESTTRGAALSWR